MEIKRLVFSLKYGPAEFLLDTLPPGLAVFFNIKIIEAGVLRIHQAYEPVRKFGISLLISAGIVFGSVFLYEIIEAGITGRNRKVRLDHCMDSFLVSFGCRFHYFRRNDVKGFNFDGKRKKLTVILSLVLSLALFVGSLAEQTPPDGSRDAQHDLAGDCLRRAWHCLLCIQPLLPGRAVERRKGDGG